jgi:hypothetical protein
VVGTLDVLQGCAPSVDLAPDIYRQRLVIEGIVARPITGDEIHDYLAQLSPVLVMVTILDPVTHCSPQYGWAGWIHWETSGAHMYAWDRPRLFFSADIYTCKPFATATAVGHTMRFFSPLQIWYREF